jgi:hypothetical protein
VFLYEEATKIIRKNVFIEISRYISNQQKPGINMLVSNDVGIYFLETASNNSAQQ